MDNTTERDAAELRLDSLARTFRLHARDKEGQARHDMHDDARAIDVAIAERRALLAERALHVARYHNLRDALGENYPTAEEVVGAAIAAIHERRRLRVQLTEAQADAERWRAFIGSSRIRFFGTAGPDVHNYAHFGGEFWTGVPADKYDEQTHESTRANAEWLVKYADAARLASSSEPPPTTETPE